MQRAWFDPFSRNWRQPIPHDHHDGRKTYVILVNYNGWRDTVECLESVFRSDYPSYQVIVCDNGSQDESLSQVAHWAEGRLLAPHPSHEAHSRLTLPPVQKPVPYVVYDRATAEKGGQRGDERYDLILIQAGDNLGFAGGNNVALRYCLSRSDFAYIWLLNNDTIVANDALTALVNRARERPGAGLCGSRLVYYHDPERIQAYGGGIYNYWLGFTRRLGANQPTGSSTDVARVESRMNYVEGASMLVSREFLVNVGLLSESYFLFFEEIDWAKRAVNRYTLAYAHASTVFHKGGASIGSSTDRRLRSYLADYYITRGKLRFTIRHRPICFPTVCLSLLVAIVNRVRIGQFGRVRMILQTLVSPGTYAGLLSD